MSDTAVNDTTNTLAPDGNTLAPDGNTLSLDGDMPRLGSSAPMIPDLPAATFTNIDSGPTLPVVSQVLTDNSSPTLPTLPSPTLPTPAIAAPAIAVPDTGETAGPGEPRHPMAHLMPEKTRPSEASLRAAEVRAAKKAKAKKIKIGVAIGAIVVGVVIGPPLARWTIDAINEAGSTKTDEPAPEPAPQPAVDANVDPQSTPLAGLQAIDDAKQVAGEGATPAPTAP